MTPQKKKNECRLRLIAARDNRDALVSDEENRHITANLYDILTEFRVKSAFIYVSIGNEVPTHQVIDELVLRGLTVSVPCLVDTQNMIAVEFPGWDLMQPGALGILSPPSGAPCAQQIDAAIVPGLGFSSDGDRIGHGAGYYDRWLINRPDTRRIGITYERQILTQIPVAEHDVKMDVVITESRIIRFGPDD